MPESILRKDDVSIFVHFFWVKVMFFLLLVGYVSDCAS